MQYILTACGAGNMAATWEEPFEAQSAWLNSVLPWNTSAGSHRLLDPESDCYGQSWGRLVTDLAAEVWRASTHDPALRFSRIMAIARLVRLHSGGQGEALTNALMERVREEIDTALHRMKDLGGASLAVLLRDALAHEDMDVSDVPEGFLDGLSQADIASILEQLCSDAAWGRRGERLRPMTTLVAMALDSDALVEVGDRIGLWAKIDAAKAVIRFLAEGRFPGALVDATVEAFLQGKPGPGRMDLVNRCLHQCHARDQQAVAQNIRLGVFSETLDASLAREWFSYRVFESDYRALMGQFLEKVRLDPSRGRAMLFFAEWPDLPEAARIAATLPAAPEDLDPWELERASRSLEHFDPAIAFRLLRQACDHPSHALRRNRFDDVTEPAGHA